MSKQRLAQPTMIIHEVAEYYSVKTVVMLSKSRSRTVSNARTVAAYLIRNLTNRSYPEISEVIGWSDHTVALYACKKVRERKQLMLDSEIIQRNILEELNGTERPSDRGDQDIEDRECPGGVEQRPAAE